jgi:PhnB protein
MSIKQVSPYILFNGTAEKAIKLYESALGAQTAALMRFSDGPGNCKTELKDLVMHASLRVGEGTVMISDAPPDRPVPTDGNVQIFLNFSEIESLEKAFNALAAGGKVMQPLEDMFWGSRFGMLQDAYGVRWMLGAELKKA